MAVKKKVGVKKKKPVKKSPAKKAAKKAVKKAVKKAPAKKAPAKKAVTKKVVSKKAPTKKVVAKKVISKKAVAKKVPAKKASKTFVEMAKVEVLEMVSVAPKAVKKIGPKKSEDKKVNLPATAKKEGQVTLEENEFLHLKMAKAKHENPRESHPEEGVEPEVEHPPLSPIVRDTPKVGRNEPCPCGSGLKYKKCHGKV